jgi:hypothetical protein
MTRDEATTIMTKLKKSKSDDDVSNVIDAFVALGMLKLDEPKSAWQKFEDAAVAKHQWLSSNDRVSILYEVLELLDITGLKIVEK